MNTEEKVAVCSRSFSRDATLRAELQEQYANVTFNDEGRALSGDLLVDFLRGHDKAIVGLEQIDESAPGGTIRQAIPVPETAPLRVESVNFWPTGKWNGEIEFRKVWFAYNVPSDGKSSPEWVLKDISFHVKPGEAVAFVGHTGAGKTSIISLLSRFYEIQKGEILVDGVNILHIEPREKEILELRFGLKDGDGPIPKAKLDALIAELKAKKDRTEAETRLLKKAILARTMSRF